MPIVGPPETMNDTFIQQIVASLQAAIDELNWASPIATVSASADMATAL